MKTIKSLVPICALMLFIQTSCKKGISDNPAELLSAKEINNMESVAAMTVITDSIHMEAESYTSMSGIQTEACKEGGKNVGYITKGDWMNFTVTTTNSGKFAIKVRTAGPVGTLQVQKSDGTILTTLNLPSTSSGQTYTTTNGQITLASGSQTIRIYATSTGWNLNWFELVFTGTPVIPPPTITSNNLLLTSTFEDASGFNIWSKEICRPSALVISSDVARKGKTSARFEFTKSDVTNFNGYVRSEIHQNSQVEAEQWFGFSNYLPADFVTDPLAEKIAQWHEVPDWALGENWRSPPISLGIENGRYYLQILWAAAAVNTNDTKDGEKKFDLGPVDKSKWNDWVFHIKFSYKTDGILEIFKNKTKVLSYYGPNSFNDKYYPYFKIGIYKWGWNGWASYSPENKRVLYYDEVRIGNKNASLTEVSPQ